MELFYCTVPILLLVVIAFSAPYVISPWQRTRVSKAWQQMNQHNGVITSVADKKRAVELVGEINGRKIKAECRTIIIGGFEKFPAIQFRFPTWSHLTEVSIELKPQKKLNRLELRQPSLSGKLAAKLLNDENAYTKTGDASFDRRFIIDGENAAFSAKALANASIRAGLINLRKSASLTIVKNSSRIDYSASGLETNSESFLALLLLLSRWADEIDAI
jgi:hypothetical protein